MVGQFLALRGAVHEVCFHLGQELFQVIGVMLPVSWTDAECAQTRHDLMETVDFLVLGARIEHIGSACPADGILIGVHLQ